MKINKQQVFTLNDQDIYEYTLMNESDCYVKVLNFGGIVTEIGMPDKNNKIENVVLAYENYKDYLDNPAYLGCMVGRNAGRISDGEFILNSKKYVLAQNNSTSNLHGGNIGFNKKVMDVKETIISDSCALEFYFSSHDGEEGFPGRVSFKCIYSLNNDNEFKISYYGDASEETIVNLTNHSYFNLNGNSRDTIHNHFLQIPSKEFIKINETTVPTEKSSVFDTPFDFNKNKKLSLVLDSNHSQIQYGNGLDHPFIIEKEGTIVLENEENGRVLEIETNQPCAIVYSGNFLDQDIILKGNIPCSKNKGIAIETQWYPNFINISEFPHLTVSPEKPYYNYTIYKFKVK